MNEHPKLDAVLEHFEGVRGSARGFRADCPVHGGKSPGDVLITLGDAWVNVHCFANCDWHAVITAAGLTPQDLVLDENAPRSSKRKPVGQRELFLTTTECCLKLQHEPEVLKRLRFGRGWAAKALEMLGVGWNGSRLTVPVHAKDGMIHDVLRYDPFATSGRKMLATKGKGRLPFPAPESMEQKIGFLVEGEGTAISMLSIGFRAVGLPGSLPGSTDTQRPGQWRGPGWHKTWAQRFRAPTMILFPDCDDPGRRLMRAAQYDLEHAGIKAHIIELGPKNLDGSDISDQLLSKAWDGPSRKAAKNIIRELVAERAEVLVPA